MLGTIIRRQDSRKHFGFLGQRKTGLTVGVTIDNALNFHEHVSELVRKVSNQPQVLKRKNV